MGQIYIVATPIGNLKDITVRAAEILLETQVIVAESASKAGILLNFIERTFNRRRVEGQTIISMTESEEVVKIPKILKEATYNNIALISEAGTPLISDPGFKLIRSAIKHRITIVSIPGANAVTSALAASGLPTDKFFFVGFLPNSTAKKLALFKEIKVLSMKTTIVAFESPHRILETLEKMQNILGDTNIVIAREITKIHEEYIRGSVSSVIKQLENNKIRGELVILINTSVEV